MANELEKLVYFLISLAFIATLTAFIFTPMWGFVFSFSSFVSLFSELFLVVTIGIALILLPSYGIAETISKLAIYRKLANISDDIYFARRKNFLNILILNLFLSIPLLLTIIFFINTIWPFNNSDTIGDIDYAFLTAIILIPGYLLSLRLLANPVKKGSKIFFLSILARPKYDLDMIKVLKERVISFYFAFMETALFSLIILYTYQALKVKSFASLYSSILVAISPKLPGPSISIFIFAFILTLLITTAIGEFVLEWKEPIDQE